MGSRKKEIDSFKFQKFSTKQLRVLNWWQPDSPAHDKFMVIADGSIRSGKFLTLSAKLPSQNGYILMGDIKVGDKIFDRLGNPTKVLAIYPQGKKDIWEITFHDGSKCRCGKEHLWSYTTKKCVSNGNKTVFTSTLGEIMDDLDRFKDRKTMHERAGKYVFPLNGCVQYAKQEVKLDPYLLGLLLGDGCFSSKSAFSFTNDEYYLHEYVANSVGEYGATYSYRPRNDMYCARGYLCKSSKFKDILVSYNLYGCKSESKFIPKEYKYNTKEVRLYILAGLLNTDGSVHVKNRPSIEYCSVSKQMYDDVAEVARSLGMFVNTDKKVDSREKNKHDCYTLCIRVNDDLYKLLSPKHKARLNMDAKKQKNWRLIKSIEYVGKEEAQCIYVDNKEHLYLTDDFIVTHNTVSMALSFLLFLMTNFNQMDAAMAGKTVGALRRNLVNPLKKIANTVGYEIIDHRSENYLEVKDGDTTNYVWLFGAKDEASQDLVDCAVCG